VSRGAAGTEDAEGHVVCHRGGVATMISVKDVSKSYKDIRVLSDVALTIDEGEILALVGETGSGKTTLAYLIAGTIKPDCGEIIF